MRRPHSKRLLLVALGLLASLACTAFAKEARTASFSERRATQSAAQKQAQELPLTVESFGNTVTLDGQAGAVLSFTLPESVYKGLHTLRFEDICVFDAHGAPVPFQLRHIEQGAESLTLRKDVPHFIWRSEKGDAGTPGSMDIEINTSGGIVRIKGQTGNAPRPGPIAFILDMKDFLDAVGKPADTGGSMSFAPEDIKEQTLTVSLGGDATFMTSVTLQTSEDFTQWRKAGKTQVLTRMRQGDVTLERDTLILPTKLERYLLLCLSDSEAPILAFAAKALFDKTTEETRETIIAGALSEDKRIVSYMLPGRFPVSAVGFDLPQADMMAVRLMGAHEPNRPYSELAKGFIYRLEKGGATLTGEPFPVHVSYHYWKLHAAGDIPFATAPGMRVYWKPRELLFLARGQGPWTLAYGRGTPVQATALPMLAQGDILPAREIAALTTPFSPPAQQMSREWILWSVLGLAAVFLTGVTLWLIRSMKQ